MNLTTAIHEVYRSERGIPFVWGSNDCLSFAAACAEKITGIDPMSALRGRYDTAMDAKRVMVEEGWGNLGDMAASMFAEIHVSEARTGDWALIVNEDKTETIGVVCGPMIAAKLEAGIGQAPRSRMTRAFRVE